MALDLPAPTTTAGFGAYARAPNGSYIAGARAYQRFGLEPGQGLRAGSVQAFGRGGGQLGAGWHASGYHVLERPATPGFGTAARWAGRAGGAASFVTGAVDSYRENRDLGQGERLAHAGAAGTGALAGGLAGAKGGAIVGASIGTFVGGPVGTAVGGVVGGVAGGIAGSQVGQAVGEGIADAGSAVADKIGGLFDGARSLPSRSPMLPRAGRRRSSRSCFWPSDRSRSTVPTGAGRAGGASGPGPLRSSTGR